VNRSPFTVYRFEKVHCPKNDYLIYEGR